MALALDRGQGYYFARPMPPGDLRALLVATSGARLVLPVT